MKKFTEKKIRQILEVSYDKAVNGIAHLHSAPKLAQQHQKHPCIHKQVDSLIRWQILKAGSIGFVCGLGGVVLLPITLPFNITSVLYIQIRMIAAIAHIAGYDIKDERVKSMIFLCLVGNSALEILKEIGIVVGKQVTTNTLKKMTAKGFVHINQAIILKIMTKLGEKTSLNTAKVIPILGGIIGGGVDMIATKVMANTAKRIFLADKSEIN